MMMPRIKMPQCRLVPLRDGCAVFADRLIGDADQAHDLRLKLRDARQVAIRAGGGAFELSEFGDVLAILHVQRRLRRERRAQPVLHGGEPQVARPVAAPDDHPIVEPFPRLERDRAHGILSRRQPPKSTDARVAARRPSRAISTRTRHE
jgi:hypothetical protein